jgi:hypothetical protein
LEKGFRCKIRCLFSGSDIVQVVFVPAHAQELARERKGWLCSHFSLMVVNALQAVKVKLVFFVVVLKIASLCDCFNPSNENETEIFYFLYFFVVLKY